MSLGVVVVLERGVLGLEPGEGSWCPRELARGLLACRMACVATPATREWGKDNEVEIGIDAADWKGKEVGS